MRSDPEIMRYIRAPITNRSESENWINLVSSRWQSDRFGFCAVIDKQSQKFIGWCGLWVLKENDEIEVGYALAKEYQGRGLATEAAARVLQYGFAELKLEKIVALARHENLASRRVMEKLGLKYDHTGTFYEMELAHHVITRDEWLRRP
jgi:ribosomal-protein-alanine N-acetyltransferase